MGAEARSRSGRQHPPKVVESSIPSSRRADQGRSDVHRASSQVVSRQGLKTEQRYEDRDREGENADNVMNRRGAKSVYRSLVQGVERAVRMYIRLCRERLRAIELTIRGANASWGWCL